MRGRRCCCCAPCPRFGHGSERYHYFVGSKYFRELGYTHLYRCSAVAEAEGGREEAVAARYLRDLASNRVVRAREALDDPADCHDRFTPERWQAFLRDVSWFRSQLPERDWRSSQVDHGYNATPVWGTLGGLLAATGPATPNRIFALRLVDIGLLAIGGGAVAWAFGWRTLCVALLYWGTNYPAQYGWTGGSYLRQLELVAILLAIALARRARPLAAGGCLGVATLVRVFPALLWVGPGLQALVALASARRLRAAALQLRLAAGGLLAAAVLVPASLWVAGPAAWSDFAANSRVLVDTPLRNHLGLRTLLAWDPQQRARRETFAKRRALFVGLVAAYGLLLAAAVRHAPLWVALVLSAGAVPVAAELTCYYSVVLVVFALLWERHPPLGAALCGLSATGWWMASGLLFYDEIFTWISLASVAFVVLATTWVAVARRSTPTGNSGRGGAVR